MAARFLFAEEGCTSQMLFEAMSPETAFPRQAHVVVTGSKAALGRMVAQGRGVALLPGLVVARELASGELVRLDTPLVPTTVNIVARWRTGLGPAEKPLRALLGLARRHQVAER